MDNLYIIGCPRSMTSFVYKQTVKSIGGRCGYASAGEILNPDRIGVAMTDTHYIMKNKKQNFKHWTDQGRHIREEVLQQFEESNEFGVLKDVVVPHIVCDFVAKKECNTLLVYKDIPMIAYSCAKKGWYYPRDILDNKTNDKNEDLLRAIKYMYDQYFEPLSRKSHVEIISTGKLQESEQYLIKRLENLGYNTQSIKYITPGFKRKTRKVQKYKDTDLYKELSETYSTMIK